MSSGNDNRLNLAEIHFDVWPYGDALWIERRAMARGEHQPKLLEGVNFYIGGPVTYTSVHTAILRTASQLRSLAYLDSAHAVVKVHAEERRAPKIGTFDEACGEVSDDGIDLEFAGACPVQGYGMVHGNPAYYRSRGTGWSLDVYAVGVDVCSEEDPTDPIFSHDENPYAFPDGGWIHRDESIANIRKAAAAFAAWKAENP
jgi:hypothetical protein